MGDQEHEDRPRRRLLLNKARSFDLRIHKKPRSRGEEMSEQEQEQETGQETEPIPTDDPGARPAVDRVVDTAREYVAAHLGETEADEQLSKLADAIDELDGTTNP